MRLWNRGADGDSETQRVYFDEFNHAVLGGFGTRSVVRHHIDAYGRPYTVSSGPELPSAEKQEAFKSHIDETLANVILEQNRLAKENAKPLSQDQAERLWKNLCHPGYAHISVNSVGQWLLDVAYYNSPIHELEGLLQAADSVSQDQFVNALAHRSAKEEKPAMNAAESLKKPISETLSLIHI